MFRQPCFTGSGQGCTVAAENYYSRTAAHHHDHVGSTAVPGQLSEARGCPAVPAPARKRNKAANAAAAQPSLPHGGGAAASREESAEALFPLNTNDIAPTQRGAVLETGAWCRSDRPEAQTTVTRSPPGLPSVTRSPPGLPSRGAAGPATSGLASARGGPSTRAADHGPCCGFPLTGPRA